MIGRRARRSVRAPSLYAPANHSTPNTTALSRPNTPKRPTTPPLRASRVHILPLSAKLLVSVISSQLWLLQGLGLIPHDAHSPPCTFTPWPTRCTLQPISASWTCPRHQQIPLESAPSPTKSALDVLLGMYYLLPSLWHSVATHLALDLFAVTPSRCPSSAPFSSRSPPDYEVCAHYCSP